MVGGNDDVGERLRRVRGLFGLSQRELAKRAGVTNGLISLIEQNRVSPSIGSLRKVLAGLPMTLVEFLTLDLGVSRRVFYTLQDLPDVGRGEVQFRLVGFDRPDRAMSILHETYLPGADTGSEMLSHSGQEGGVVVRGRIELTVGAQQRLLGPGDSYYFESRLPHRFRNPGAEVCEIVSANSPPTL